MDLHMQFFTTFFDKYKFFLQVVFKVANPAAPPAAEGGPDPPPAINSPRRKEIGGGSGGGQSTPAEVVRPIEDVRSFQTGLDRSTLTGRRSDRYPRRRNGPVKQEASTMSPADRCRETSVLVFLLALFVTWSSCHVVQYYFTYIHTQTMQEDDDALTWQCIGKECLLKYCAKML